MRRARFRYGKIISEIFFPEKGNGKAIVISYGLPSSPLGNDSIVVRKFLKNGFVVCCPRYIGTHDSYGKFTFRDALKTIENTVEFLVKGKGVSLWSLKKIEWKAKEIILMGGSFGGAVSLVVGADNRYVKKIVAFCPPTRFEGREGIRKTLLAAVMRGWENTWRGVNKNVWKGIRTCTPLEHVTGLKKKDVLLIHGKKDDVVPYEESMELYNKIKTGKGRHKLVLLKMTEHGGNSLMRRDGIFREVLKFIS